MGKLTNLSDKLNNVLKNLENKDSIEEDKVDYKELKESVSRGAFKIKDKLKGDLFSNYKFIFWFTIIYLICEVIYNLGLVEFLSSPNTEITIYNRLEFFGKVLSSIGLSLILLKLVPKFKNIAFLILVPFLFISETVVFDKIVDNLSPTMKTGAYIQGTYRNAVLNKSLNDDRVKNESAYEKVLTANVILLNDTNTQNNKIHTLFSPKVDDKVFDSYYANYQKIYGKLDSYYKIYAIESKRFTYSNDIKQGIADKRFENKAGVPRGLNREQFMEAVKKKLPAIEEFNNTYVIPPISAIGYKGLLGKEIPDNLNESQFREFFNNQIQIINSKTVIAESVITQLPHSKEMISSVVIPPLAICLSFLSILLNLTSLIAMRFKKASLIPLVAVAIIYATYTNNPFKINTYINRAVGLESSLYTILTPVASLIHSVSINDENPNEEDIIRVKPAKEIDFSELDNKFNSIKDEPIDPEVEKRMQEVDGDINRIENDRNYFGHLKTKSNINPYTGKPYEN